MRGLTFFRSLVLLQVFILVAPDSIAATSRRLKTLVIVDETQSNFKRPTNPQKVSKDYLQNTQQTDVTKALKQVPGIYVRDEDGMGLRPNIGLRGTNPDRSKKITFLEDGVLAGPAPYSAPAAYYSPSVLHTDSLEVFKGFAAVPYGPNSIGGTVQYLSKTMTMKNHGDFQTSFGSFGNKIFQTTLEVKPFDGADSVLIHGNHVSSDGFKTLPRGGDTGFTRNDFLLKLRHPFNEDVTHFLDLRLGYADENSKETYLGVSTNDFAQKPYARYEASSQDQMKWQQQKIELEHNIMIGENGVLKTTAYFHSFDRTWYRFDRFADGTSTFEVLRGNNPALDTYLNVLRGQQDTTPSSGTRLVLARNHRTFISEGMQSKLLNTFSYGEIEHEFEMGARLHYDEIKRNHTLDTYDIANGRMAITSNIEQPETLNKDSALAKTIYTRNDFILRDWTFSAVGRFESVEYKNSNDLTQIQNNRLDSVFIPGVGAAYRFTPELSTRLSYNQGASLAGLSSSGKEVRERSQNYEAEIKFVKPTWDLMSDLVLFINDYSNITGTCTQSTGCASNLLDTQYNGGKAKIYGAEFRLAKLMQFETLQVPLQFNTTYIHSSFERGFTSTSAEWGTGDVKVGDPLPYVPLVQYSAMIGTVYKKFRQDLSFTYSGSVYDQSVEVNRLKIPAYGIVDWTGSYEIFDKQKISLKADNIFAKEYAVSFRPFGMRPGKPQTFMVGYQYSFE